jgi:LAO/AO transport system kinase
MQAHASDEGVFIRSMATRGHLGGLSRATSDAALVLDASGRDVVVIETVGVGQDEVEIVRAADVSVGALVPGTGDDVQALKAGIMEIADVFVVNKADREGADRLVSAIEATLSLHSYGAGEWRPAIVQTVATTGAGVGDLLKAIWAFRAHAAAGEGSRRHVRSAYRLREIVAKRLLDRLEQQVLAQGELAGIVDRIASRDTDPYSAADALIARLIK